MQTRLGPCAAGIPPCADSVRTLSVVNMSTVKKVKKITKSVKKDGGGETITTETSTTISSSEGGEMERSKGFKLKKYIFIKKNENSDWLTKLIKL